ncbi:MAG: hypothetical protein EpisKO_40800 [Epibacterium sp.]
MKFLYVVQTEAGLPEVYSPLRDRVVLVSWKEQTPQTTVFAPGSTWTTGRNAAINHITKTSPDFDYLIFLDDDVQFDGISHAEGFQRFERFLKRKRPAIGLPRCWDYNTRPHKLRSLPTNIHRQGLQNAHLKTQPVDWFDACYNAFRRDVFLDTRLLPYNAQYDDASWYASQLVLIFAANLFYRNKIIQDNRISIVNTSQRNEIQRPYPRRVDVFGKVYKDFLVENNISGFEMSSVGFWDRKKAEFREKAGLPEIVR